MDVLWAPWRMEYIVHPKTEGCVLCAAIERGANREDFVLHVGPLGAVVMNRFPYGHGHLMVLPRRHTADFAGLAREEQAELSDLLRACTEVLSEAMYPQGFNLGMNLGQVGGAGIVDHLHWHILPRWPGDVNALALICEVKSIPEHLAVTYDKLRPLFVKRLG
ncbi:MAG TPA: HIT family hydrolase [Planctomycetes bacterium]|nr:HIT family hydrolase [Planctomycetota bacterium]